MNELGEILWPLGRLLLGGLYVYGGVEHFLAFAPIAGAMKGRVPLPRLALFLGSVFQIAAGALLVAGIAVPYAAFGLVLFTLAASIMLLNFWSLKGPERQAAITNWQSNVAIIGGLLVTAGYSA